jgi:hypothetical protein
MDNSGLFFAGGRTRSLKVLQAGAGQAPLHGIALLQLPSDSVGTPAPHVEHYFEQGSGGANSVSVGERGIFLGCFFVKRKEKLPICLFLRKSTLRIQSFVEHFGCRQFSSSRGLAARVSTCET